jgi:non-ribosomal peptide synthetase component F
MSVLTMPRVLARGRWWSADELDAIAWRWRAAAREALGDEARLVAAALPATPEGVALFVALSCLPSPLIALGPDPRFWRTEPGVPAGTPLALTPSMAHLVPEARERGLAPFVLPEPAGSRGAGAPVVPLQGPGVVVFTSGSTDLPKPVFHPMTTLRRWVTARSLLLGLGPGAGTLIGVSLASAQGLNFLVASILLGGPLGLLDPLDHRAALEALARPEFECWRATPHFADVLYAAPRHR